MGRTKAKAKPRFIIIGVLLPSIVKLEKGFCLNRNYLILDTKSGKTYVEPYLWSEKKHIGDVVENPVSVFFDE